MKCHFVDSRIGFFSALAEKLGPEFEFAPQPTEETYNSSDVILLGVPACSDPVFQARMSLLHRIGRTPGAAPVIAAIPHAERHTTRLVFQAGAYDCFVETASIEEIRIVLRRAAQFREMTEQLGHLRGEAPNVGFRNVIGSNPKMRAIYAFAARVANTDASILITGETGTGKDLLARNIHEGSQRVSQPFLSVSCSSLPEHLIEAELFGHERGAFTGANNSRQGRFEAVQTGTLFLDEIGELSPGLQVKLLRVLQDRLFERLGSNTPREFKGRVICATNRNLREMVQSGKFRSDLFYRLNTIEMLVPPLRERRDDILSLAYHLLRHFALKYDRPAHRIAASAMTALQEYSWPGNVRELQHVIERAVVMSDGAEVRIEQLPEQFLEFSSALGVTFENEVKEFKRRLIQRALAEFGNNKLQAARSLGIARSSLHRLIEELHIGHGPEPMVH
jgi:two-component system, NtrC family, response regulator AtoC